MQARDAEAVIKVTGGLRIVASVISHDSDRVSATDAPSVSHDYTAYSTIVDSTIEERLMKKP